MEEEEQNSGSVTISCAWASGVIISGFCVQINSGRLSPLPLVSFFFNNKKSFLRCFVLASSESTPLSTAISQDFRTHRELLASLS